MTDSRASLRWLLILIASTAILMVGALIWARPLVISLLISALLAYLIDPAVRGVQSRWGFSRTTATNLVLIGTLALLFGLASALSAVVWEAIPEIQIELNEAWQQVSNWSAQPIIVLGIPIQVQTILRNLQQSTVTAVTALPVGSGSILGQITDNLLWSTVTLVSLYYFLKDGPRLKPWITALLPVTYHDEGRRILDEIDWVWGIFLRVQLFIFLILAILIVVSTSLILFLYHGGWLRLSPVGLAILLVLIYTAIQQVDNLWLRPQLLGSRFRLHPGVVFVALISGLAIGGVMGALIIVPIVATIKVLYRNLRIALLHEQSSFAETQSGLESESVPDTGPAPDQRTNGEPTTCTQTQPSAHLPERLAQPDASGPDASL